LNSEDSFVRIRQVSLVGVVHMYALSSRTEI
jgi:hypothetical protein